MTKVEKMKAGEIVEIEDTFESVQKKFCNISGDVTQFRVGGYYRSKYANQYGTETIVQIMDLVAYPVEIKRMGERPGWGVKIQMTVKIWFSDGETGYDSMTGEEFMKWMKEGWVN